MLIVEERAVDLKWSLWSRHREGWIEYGYDEVLALMEAAFEGYEVPPIDPQDQGDVVAARILTAPRKEGRTGSVLITEGKAEVDFRAEADGEYDGEEGPPRIVETVTAETFQAVMEGIDALEQRLIEACG